MFNGINLNLQKEWYKKNFELAIFKLVGLGWALCSTVQYILTVAEALQADARGENANILVTLFYVFHKVALGCVVLLLFLSYYKGRTKFSGNSSFQG